MLLRAMGAPSLEAQGHGLGPGQPELGGLTGSWQGVGLRGEGAGGSLPAQTRGTQY